MLRRLLIALMVIIVVIVIGVVILTLSTPLIQSSLIVLPNSFDDSPAGFTFRYPEGWSYIIPMQGLLVSAPPETLSQSEAGQTFTVQRNAPLSVYGTLDEALDIYLRRGALRPDRMWNTISEIERSTFLGREALVVDLEGRENEASPESRAHVVITTAENSFVYTFVLTAPGEQWADVEATLFAMLDSLILLE